MKKLKIKKLIQEKNQKNTYLKQKKNINKSSNNNLCNKKRKRDKDIWNIYKETKFKNKKDEIELNVKNKDKFDANQNNIVILLDSDTPLINPIKNRSKKFRVQNYYSNSFEIKTQKELIKKKRDIIWKKLITEKKLGDIERGLYREFRDYLKKNRDKFHLYNDFWDNYFEEIKKKDKHAIILIMNDGDKDFKSYIQDLLEFILSRDDIPEKYKAFLEDKNYNHKYNPESIYKKNLYKIYSEKYKESDLELDNCELNFDQ